MTAPEHDRDRSCSQPRVWRWGDPVEIVSRYLESDRIVAIPTESSYGLAVRADSEAAVAALVRLKGRAAESAFPVVADSMDTLRRLGASFEPRAEDLARRWPAALTLVVPLERPVAAARGLSTLAVRIPDHDRLRGLLSALGIAVTATSANRSGAPPILTVPELTVLLAGCDALIVDDGDLVGGAPSTLVGWEEGRLRLLRDGRFPTSALPSMP